MQQLFYYKIDRILLQNASGLLLQNATVLLQNVTVITNCDHTEEYQLIEIYIQVKFHFVQYKLKFNLNSTF